MKREGRFSVSTRVDCKRCLVIKASMGSSARWSGVAGAGPTFTDGPIFLLFYRFAGTRENWTWTQST